MHHFELHLLIVSNMLFMHSKNLNRTLGLGSFLYSFPLVYQHITSSNRLYRLVAVCIVYLVNRIQAERGINSPRFICALSVESQSFSAALRSEYVSGTARCPYKRKSPDFRQGLSFSGRCRRLSFYRRTTVFL